MSDLESNVPCVDCVVLVGAIHVIHHQGFAGEETLEDRSFINKKIEINQEQNLNPFF